MKKSVYAAAVFASGCLWGLMGFFRRQMGDIGFGTDGVILVRCGVSALLYIITMALRDPMSLKVKIKDLWCFFGSGVCSLLFFSACYFQAMQLMSLSAAAILLYTAPCFVILMSAVLFKEKINGRIILSMLLAFSGCCLVSGIVGSETKISFVGLLYGLGSGFGYALYSIFGKFAMARGYKSVTVSMYSCLFSAVGAALIWGAKGPVEIMFANGGNFVLCILSAAITCYLPYLMYTYGLSGIEAGKASIIASIEPVVATLVGVFVFNEVLGMSGLVGMLLVLAAIILSNSSSKKGAKT